MFMHRNLGVYALGRLSIISELDFAEIDRKYVVNQVHGRLIGYPMLELSSDDCTVLQ